MHLCICYLKTDSLTRMNFPGLSLHTIKLLKETALPSLWQMSGKKKKTTFFCCCCYQHIQYISWQFISYTRRIPNELSTWRIRGGQINKPEAQDKITCLGYQFLFIVIQPAQTTWASSRLLFFFFPLLSFNNQRKKIKTYSPLTYAKMNIFKQIVFHGGATHLDAVTCCTTHMRFYLYVCTKMDMTFSALQSRGTTNKAKRYKKLSYKFCYHNMWSPCG